MIGRVFSPLSDTGRGQVGCQIGGLWCAYGGRQEAHSTNIAADRAFNGGGRTRPSEDLVAIE